MLLMLPGTPASPPPLPPRLPRAALPQFRHYGDLWRLNLTDWTWEQIPSKGGPLPRSGHRMVLAGKRLVLFGGFHDSGKETR